MKALRSVGVPFSDESITGAVEELELEKLRRENAVLESKKTVLDSNTNTERLMAEAISAMRSYQGDE